MARLCITLLGAFQAATDGQPIGALYSDKVRALLAYLAVEADHPHRRETLAGLLWPGYPERSARQSLSQALFALRQALERGAPGLAAQALSTSRQEVQLDLGETCQADAATFAALLAACQAHAHDAPLTCSACATRRRQALALYGGDLLTGFSLPDSPEFEEWLVLRRERLRHMVVEALEAQTAHETWRGDLAAALDCAQRWAEIEPLDEAAQRAVMRLLAQGGRRSAALAQYERCRQALREELDVAPEPATMALYERIRDGRLGAGPRPSAPTPAAPPPFLVGEERFQAPPFVARERELAQLQAHLAQALAGQPRVVFVTGEPGSGKTALLRAFCLRAMQAQPDLVAVTGHCNAHTGIGDPYLAFRELLAQLTGDVETRWAAGGMGREQATRLWGLLPEAGQALVERGSDLVGTLVLADPLLTRALAAAPGAPWCDALQQLVAARAAQRGGANVQQPALFSQYTAVLQRLAERRPILLILEDLQWADLGSASLLFHLGCHLQGERILIVGTYRPTEVFAERAEERHLLAPVIHEFVRRFGDIEVDLGRADEHRFVEALLDAEPNDLGADFRATLLRQSGGNPLFTVELLRDLQERERLTQDSEGRWIAAAELDWNALPARVEGVLAERIGRLPAPLRETLRVASVEGEAFHLDTLARVLEIEPREMVRRLSAELDRNHRLVNAIEGQRREGGMLGRYRFRHVLMQNYLYGTLDPVERAYLHRSVAEALEATYDEHIDEAAVQLAWHYQQAGIADKAVTYLQRAGDRAARLSANHEAATHYMRALALLETLPVGQERDRRELVLQLALSDVIQATRGFSAPEVETVYCRVAELSRQVGDTSHMADALILQAVFYGIRGEHALALAIGEQAADLARHSENETLLAVTGAVKGWVRVSIGDYAQAVRDLAPLVALCRAHEEAVLADTVAGQWAVSALTWTACALSFLGHLDQGTQLAHESLALAYKIGRAQDIVHALSVACSQMRLYRREFPEADAWAKEEIRVTAEKGLPFYEAMGRLHQGWARAHLGEPCEGIAEMRQTLAVAEAIGVGAYRPAYLCGLAEAHGLARQTLEGMAAVERGLALAAEMGEGLYLPELHRVRGELLLQQAPPDAASAEISFCTALDVARRQGARLLELRAAISLGRLWQRQGKRQEARDLVQGVYNWFSEGFDLPDLVEARALLADLDTDCTDQHQ